MCELGIESAWANEVHLSQCGFVAPRLCPHTLCRRLTPVWLEAQAGQIPHMHAYSNVLFLLLLGNDKKRKKRLAFCCINLLGLWWIRTCSLRLASLLQLVCRRVELSSAYPTSCRGKTSPGVNGHIGNSTLVIPTVLHTVKVCWKLTVFLLIVARCVPRARYVLCK